MRRFMTLPTLQLTHMLSELKKELDADGTGNLLPVLRINKRS